MKKIKKSVTSDGNIYSGEVTIRLLKNDVPYKVIKQHNNATVEFLEYILKSISQTAKSEDIINCVSFCNYDDEKFRCPGTFSININKEDSSRDQPALASIGYNVLVPSSLIAGKDNISINKVKLKSVSGLTYAISEVNPEIIVNSNTNIWLTWKIILKGESTTPPNIKKK